MADDTPVILATTFVNTMYPPSTDATVKDWGEGVAGGTSTFPTSGSWEWIPVLPPLDQVASPITALSGVVAHQHVAGQDNPFSHPFGYDWNVDVVPDLAYWVLVAPGNKTAVMPASGADKADLWTGISWAIGQNLYPKNETPGVMHVELDSGFASPAFRSRSSGADGGKILHDRVAVFGRWIVDCGHANFQSEIHPPLVLAIARAAGPVTRSTVIARPCTVGQLWGDAALLKYLVTQILKIYGTVVVSLGLASLDPSLKLEAHAPILPPFTGAFTMSYVVRPARARKNPTEQLVASYRFVVRTGVEVAVVSTGDDGVLVTIVAVDTPYNAAKPAPPFNKHDWVIGLDYLQANDPSIVPAVKAALGFSTPALGFTDPVLGAFVEAILARGVTGDRYEQVLSPVVVGALPTQVQVDKMPDVAAQTIDDTQPFPITGWLDLAWEGDTVDLGTSLQLDVLIHFSDIGDLIFPEATVGDFPGEVHRVEGFMIRFNPTVPGLSLEYMATLDGEGDSAWVPEGTFVGTRGQSRRILGFAIRLTPDTQSDWEITYQANIATVGPVTASNGDYCGVRGQPNDIQSIQVTVTSYVAPTGGKPVPVPPAPISPVKPPPPPGGKGPIRQV